MKMKIASLCMIATLAFCADDAIVTSAAFVATLDTYEPHAVISAGAVTIPYGACDAVTTTAPSGTDDVLLEYATESGSLAWTPNSGGVWMFSSARQGETTFTVRYSIFGARGAGTEADPAKIVDDNELVDIGATAGYVFVPSGVGTLLDTIILPQDTVLATLQDDGRCRLATSTAGELYESAAVATFFDTEDPGPNRRAYLNESIPVAYAGDGWRVPETTASSTITITPPSGAALQASFTGWGSMPFLPNKNGTYAITLATSMGTYNASVLVRGRGLQLILR